MKMPPKPVVEVRAADRVYLRVPFSDKDEAKAMGGRWDMPNKMWWCEKKDSTRFQKWLPPVGTVLVPTTTPAVKNKAVITPASSAAPAQLALELVQALGNKKDYTLVTHTFTNSEGKEITAPIPSFLTYKLKEKSTPDIAKIIIALGIALPVGLDVDELIDILRQNKNVIHLDETPAPPVSFKPLKELTEHELFMQRLKAKKEAEERSKRKAERGDVIEPERSLQTAHSKKPKLSNKDKDKELTAEQRELLARIEDDDYETIR